MLLAAAGLTGCNHDVFVTPLTVEPRTHTLEWTGGEAVFKSNQPISSVWLMAFGWADGRGYPIVDEGMQFSLFEEKRTLQLANDLCDIKMTIRPDGEFVVTSGYNLFADTVYVNLEIGVNFDTVERGLRILPQPGFGHSEISYDLDSWQSYESEDTIMLAQIATSYGELDYTLRKKGDVVANRAVQFKPWEKRLSDNIFGRKPFEVEEATITPGHFWPELSGQKITYSSDMQHLDGGALTYDKDIIVHLEQYRWYKIRAIVKDEHIGVSYSIKAISPVPEIKDKIIEGVYWINIPTSYTIDIESGASPQ